MDSITFGELANNYLTLESKPFKSTWKDDERRIRRLREQYGERRLDSITTLELVQLYAATCQRGKTYEANRTIETMHRLFEVARNWDLYPPDKKNPAKGIRKHKEPARDRFVKKSELPNLWQAFDRLDHAFAPAYFKLLVLTGLRRNTLRQVKWSDLDTDRWTVSIRPEIDKMGKAQVLPLSPPAIELIIDLPRREPWLFWSRQGNQHGTMFGGLMSNTQVGDYWGKVRLISGLSDLRIHDLRRTAGSYLGQAGVSPYLIARILNHSLDSAGVTAIYTRFSEEHLREALDLLGKIVMDLISPDPEVPGILPVSSAG